MSGFGSADLPERVRDAVESAGTVAARAQAAADLIRAETGRRWVGIYRVTAGEVRNIAWSGPAPPAHPNFPITEGLTGSAVLTRATVLANDVASDPRYLTNQDTTGSELIVPVLHGDEVVGTLDIEDERRGAFSHDDQAQFEKLAAALTQLYG